MVLVQSGQIPAYLNLIAINESIHCQQLIEPLPNSLLSFYKAIGLILGPVNAILNGVCVHIFKHPAWKQSAMSRILKGLSIVELCMGISLFLFAMLYAQNSNTVQKTDLIINFTQTEPNSSLPPSHEAIRKNRDRAFVHTIAWFLSMTVFSRCLVAFQVARNWSVVLLAAYRYDRICRPIGTGTALPRERIPGILIATIALSFVVVLPRVFELGIVICDISGQYAGDQVLLLRDPIYQIVYLGIVMFVVQSGGPIICVCVLSAFVIRLIAKRRKIHKMNEQKSARRLLSIQHSSRARASGQDSGPGLPGDGNGTTTSASNLNCSNSQENENNHKNNDEWNKPASRQPGMNNSENVDRTSNMLALTSPIDRPSPAGDKLIFAVCITFFILETPAFFSKILNPYLEKHYFQLDLWLSVIANVLVYLDSTLNAFVYMASNPTFRKVAYDEFVKYRSRLTGAPYRPSHSTNTCLNNPRNVSVRLSRTT
ncbi:unnamed protein product [Echinostoma caproni]|uniref:G_PROTEIN_RECEP_F1_2 domain-containing protein n=1 Tax=Echinostoma caproni TaxID=27848 RepID=A0A183A4X6_9TREM|nr:unnamed protein product [Echinostoma caproni]